MVDKVQHQIFHAAQGPRAFVKRETYGEDPKTVAVFLYPVGYIGKELLGQGIREFITGKTRRGQRCVFHVSDILIHASVPNDSEYISDPVIAQILEKPYAAAEIQEMIMQDRFEFSAPALRNKTSISIEVSDPGSPPYKI